MTYTDNGDGTIMDNVTGLMWQKGEPGTMTWADALTYCEGLSLGGQTDWRLPNIKELESITDDTKYTPAIDTTYSPNTHAHNYWSSTTHASRTGNAWSVYFANGDVDGYGKFNDNYVRCVRGGQSGSSAQNNCAVSVSSGLVVHIPIVTYSGLNYWADLQYNLNDSTLTFANYGLINDMTPYINCTASSLSSNFKLYIPALLLGSNSYWLDLQYGSSGFVITGLGMN